MRCARSVLVEGDRVGAGLNDKPKHAVGSPDPAVLRNSGCWIAVRASRTLPDGVGQLDPDFPASRPRGHSG